MGSGKSTAADYLVENYGYLKSNFKDALDSELVELYPQIIQRLTGLPPEEGINQKPTCPEMRELKQNHGTNVQRANDEDYWVKRWIETYTKTFNKNVCVDDVRFINEVDVIKRFGGIIVRINRTDITDTGDHPSETALDDFEADVTIDADPGDLMWVFMSLDKLIEDDITDGETDSNDSGAYDEYVEGLGEEGRK